jgi:hypothetical protein
MAPEVADQEHVDAGLLDAFTQQREGFPFGRSSSTMNRGRSISA